MLFSTFSIFSVGSALSTVILGSVLITSCSFTFALSVAEMGRGPSACNRSPSLSFRAFGDLRSLSAAAASRLAVSGEDGRLPVQCEPPYVRRNDSSGEEVVAEDTTTTVRPRDAHWELRECAIGTQ